MKKLLVLSAFAAMLASGTALADTSDKKIAFSNNYAGNSWRQAMLNSYDIVTKKAVADKVVAAADVFTTADKEVPTQAAQIQNLILQGYDAIVINASSPDALNGAVKQACDAGIVVVSFDGHRHRAMRLSRGRRLQGHGQAGSRADGQVPARRAAICWRFAALPERRSTTPSTRASWRAWTPIPSSRSSPR